MVALPARKLTACSRQLVRIPVAGAPTAISFILSIVSYTVLDLIRFLTRKTWIAKSLRAFLRQFD